MKTTKTNMALMLAACGAAATTAGARPAPYVLNLSGATLLQNFFIAPASTNDFVDADNDTVIREQLAAAGSSAPFPVSQLWQAQIRFVGSVNGFQELVDFGRTYATGANGVEISASTAADGAHHNRTVYISAGATTGPANLLNPGAAPVRSLSDGSYQATTSTGAGTGIQINAAPLDVSSTWAIQYPGAGAVDRQPGDAGYGTNARDSVNKDGAPANFNHLLVNAQSGNINFNHVTPDANTIFDTPLAFAPIAMLTNFGTGLRQATMTDVRHLFSTGRTSGGENLIAVTRDAGSGTRNGFNNTTATDPSWGVGENIGNQSNSSAQDLVGAAYRPSNKGGSSRMEATVQNTRLGVGYSGAERGVNNAWLTGGRLEVVGIQNDLNGGAAFARPTVNNILDNSVNGYNVGGEGVISTFGDPRASAPGFPFFGDANGNPTVPNQNMAAYLNNITRSVTAYKSQPGVGQEFMPGEFLALNFILLNARDNRLDPANPSGVVANPNVNSALQEFTRGASVYTNAAYNAFNTNNNGVAPSRTALTGGASYTDGVANGANYITEGGTIVSNGANMNPGQPLAAVGLRNRISFDFNNDGVRNISDTAAMIAAWRDRNGGPAVVDANLCIELIGDGNCDGNFDAKDVRYFADGLAMVAGVVDGVSTPVLNRKSGFTQVDVAFGGNFFATTLATPKAYANGDSRADVSRANHLTTRGWEPLGADGAVNDLDIDYVYKQFVNANIADGVADWADTAEAVHFDLSADMDGDLDVDQCDVRELVKTVLGTNYGDVNLDGAVNGSDRAVIQASIAFPPPSIGWASGDLNGDGAVTTADLAIYRSVACPGNVNGDASIDFQDLNLVLSFFGSSGQCLPGGGDVDGDGDVDFSDLNAVLSFFGTPCNN